MPPTTPKMQVFFFLLSNFSLKTFKRRLKDSKGTIINLEPSTIRLDESPTMRCSPPPSEISDSGTSANSAAPSGSAVSESPESGLSGTAASDADVKVEDGDKLEAKITADSTVAPEANESRKKEKTTPTAPVSTAVTATELPQIDENIFRALTAAVRQHRLTRKGRTSPEEKEVIHSKHNLVMLNILSLKSQTMPKILNTQNS